MDACNSPPCRVRLVATFPQTTSPNVVPAGQRDGCPTNYRGPYRLRILAFTLAMTRLPLPDVVTLCRSAVVGVNLLLRTHL